MKADVYFILLMSIVLCSCNFSSKKEMEIKTVDSSQSQMPKDNSALIEEIWPDSQRVLTRMTDTSLFKIDRNAFVNYAKSLTGTPYVYAATDPAVGFDCSGFITYVFRHFNLSVPRSSIEFTNYGQEVYKENVRPGDLILFTGTNPAERFVGHMGIVVDNSDSLRFTHSTSGKAMGVTTTALNEYYMKRFVKFIKVIQ